MARSAKLAPGGALVELLLVALAVCVVLVVLARVIPPASRGPRPASLSSAASLLSQEKIEELSARSWSDTALSIGRHATDAPAEAADLPGRWQCYYDVALLGAPIQDCKRVTVTVVWNHRGEHSTTVSTYLRR